MESDQLSKYNPHCLSPHNQLIGTNSGATKGGILLYVSNELNFEPRPDLISTNQKVLNLFLY